MHNIYSQSPTKKGCEIMKDNKKNEVKTNIKEMMKKLISGNYNCNDFSYDMPELLLELDDVALVEALDDLPEICADYDPYKTNEIELLNDKKLIEVVREMYNKVFGA